VQRFQREARLAAAIHHQNLVQVYDVSQKCGVHYLVMEFVSGETARDRVRRKGPLKVNEALRIALGAAKDLAAHGRRRYEWPNARVIRPRLKK
jgi:serine/threonine-protein kinase